MTMNKHQEYNIRQKEALVGDDDLYLLRNKGYTGDMKVSKVFECVECGKILPYPVIWFYKGDVTKVKCYECQENYKFGE